MALPAFAAECRAAAPLLLGASRCRPISPVRMALSTRQQTRRPPRLRSNDGSDKRTDGRTPDRCVDPVLHTCGQAGGGNNRVQ